MSYSYSTDGDSSDIELVSHPPAAASRPAAATSAHCDAYDSDAPQDYADFFSTAGNAAMLPTSTLGYADQSPPRRQASRSVSRSRQEPRKQTDHSDVIEIGDSDDDDGNDPQEQARQLAKLPRPTGDLRKTQSAPSAVFGGTGSISSNSNAKGKGRLFEPVDSDEEDRENEDDELPNLGSIAARASILKRANSDSIASMSTTTGLPAAKRRFKYTDSSSRKDADVSLRALSPIPASSPPPSFFEGTSRDRPVPTTRSGGLLPSDLDSSEDEGKEKKKQARKKNQAGTSAEPPSQGQPTSEAGPSKLKPLTKKQIQEQERAAKKAAKDLEKAKKAEETANLKERKNGLKVANKLEDRQAHCKEIIVDISQNLRSNPAFRDKVWIDLKARFDHVEADYKTVPARPGCFDKVIGWRRLVTRDYNPELRYWIPRPNDAYTLEQEKTVLLFLTGEEVEKAVAAHKYPEDVDKTDTLIEMVSKVRKVYGLDYQVILLVQNLSHKSKAKKSAENAAFQNEVRGTTGQNSSKRLKKSVWDDRISMEDIEQDLVRLQLLARCSIQRNEKYEDATDWIAEFTKDVAHRPYKMLERVREMYLNIDGKIESSDRGDLHKTYVNQLACIYGVTEPAARAIAAKFPTWKRLRDAFKEASDPRQTLSGIAILNRVDGAATNRSMGSALSERIHLFLTTTDPNLMFNSDIKTVRSRVAGTLH